MTRIEKITRAVELAETALPRSATLCRLYDALRQAYDCQTLREWERITRILDRTIDNLPTRCPDTLARFIREAIRYPIAVS